MFNISKKNKAYVYINISSPLNKLLYYCYIAYCLLSTNDNKVKLAAAVGQEELVIEQSTSGQGDWD
jgi:hypothetical protein